MSQLQTNLENLQEILDSINNLPEAGNNSIESVNMTLSSFAPGPIESIIFYVSPMGELCETNKAGSYQVMKNSILVISIGGNGHRVYDNYVRLPASDPDTSAYFITGDIKVKG